jgi:hypothetical protein
MKESKVAAPAPPVHVKAPETVRRNCPCGRKTPGGEECAECEKKKETLRRSALGAGPATAPPIVGEALRSPGRSLPASARAALEPGFGRDFSGVRVHTDAKAAESARAVQARAYTVGQDIVFGAGQYDPDSVAGLHLLAHELTHTVQTDGGIHRAPAEDLAIGTINDPAEREATAAADAVWKGWPVRIGPGRPGNVVYRQTACEQRGVDIGLYTRLGIPTHTAIGSLLGDARFRDPIPDGKFAGRSGYACGERDSDDDTGGDGHLDLALLNDGVLRLGEIKPDSKGCLQMGHDQVRHYAEKVMSDLNEGWRQGAPGSGRRPAAGGGTAPVINSTDWMTEGDFAAPQQVPVQGDYLVNTRWAEPGLLAYCIDTRAKPTAADFEAHSIEFFGTYTLYVAPGQKKTRLGQVPLNLSDWRRFKHDHNVELWEAVRVSAQRIEVTGRLGSLQQGERGPTFVSEANVRFFFIPGPPGSARRLELVTRTQWIRGRLGLMSEVNVRIEMGETGLRGFGPINPSLPLLKSAPVHFEMEQDRMAAVLKGDVSKARPALPGARLTSADLRVQIAPTLEAKGQLGIAFGPASRPYAAGILTISADENGLVAAGKVTGQIPGIDQAKGEITYKNGRLSGSLNLGTSFKVPIPGVSITNVALTGAFDENGLAVGGQVDATLPGNTKVTLGAAGKPGGPIVYTGKVHVEVPKLKGVDVDVTYDGDHFEGSAQTAVEYRGLVGNVTVHYRDGDVFGGGTVAIRKGKLNGKMNLKLSKEHRLSGDGSVEYPLSEKVVGKIGVKLYESGKLTVVGGLRLVQPVQIFEGLKSKAPIEKELFHQLFPVPGLSLPVIGGVGVDVSLKAGFEYGVGPGTLHDVFIETQFDPFEEDPNLVLKGGAQFKIPAHAGVYLKFSGGIGVGNNWVSASGGLSILGEVGVDGAFHAKVDLEYAKKRFVVEAKAVVEAGLTLIVKLSIYVEGRALSWTGRKEWELAGFSWGTGSQIQVIFPIRYASDETFQMPSLDSIQVKLPQIDVPGAVKQLLGQARTNEKPGK